MSYFGTAPDAGLEVFSHEEALLQMEELEDHGAIHAIWTLMTPFIGSVCNCSYNDCLAMRTLTGIGVETMARAEYVARADEDRCSGCGLCTEHCQFNAISSKINCGRDVSTIDPDKCFGCGLCRKECTEGALTLELRYSQPDTIS